MRTDKVGVLLRDDDPNGWLVEVRNVGDHLATLHELAGQVAIVGQDQRAARWCSDDQILLPLPCQVEIGTRKPQFLLDHARMGKIRQILLGKTPLELGDTQLQQVDARRQQRILLPDQWIASPDLGGGCGGNFIDRTIGLNMDDRIAW
ncbi:hypothetical protein D9M72_509560 [compost metagenome]